VPYGFFYHNPSLDLRREFADVEASSHQRDREVAFRA